MNYDTWLDKNEDYLVEKFVRENPELPIFDDDLANLPQKAYFQNWAENLWNKKYGIHPGWRVKTTYNPKWTAYSVKYFENKANAYAFAKDVKNKGGYYRIDQVNIIRCPSCGNLKIPEEDCLTCEKGLLMFQ